MKEKMMKPLYIFDLVWYVVGYFGVALMIYDILTGKFL